MILQRYFEEREEERWRPARQDLYRRLFSHAGWLISMLPSDVREGGAQTGKEFGHWSEPIEAFFGWLIFRTPRRKGATCRNDAMCRLLFAHAAVLAGSGLPFEVQTWSAMSLCP